jgi:hypothetical protein
MIERECDRPFGYLGEKGDRTLGFGMENAIALFVIWGKGRSLNLAYKKLIKTS